VEDNSSVVASDFILSLSDESLDEYNSDFNPVIDLDPIETEIIETVPGKREFVFVLSMILGY
jgi:hypothetical protein